ncbi:hypothetical protein VCRA2113O415_440008 [Vibrio crassostreae]|nr:hypothetical protein VCRA2113O415_440008 [Vibrio crassostreae]CAK2865121.1 hypothetical protein VCRA2113O420_420008 [Vibrio crassostreae]CAK3477426.1 hypothetical protein VCRA2121O436_410028 [Vibrio crassostreae]
MASPLEVLLLAILGEIQLTFISAILGCNASWSDKRHLLPGAALLRTQRATFTALGSSLREGVLCTPTCQ